MIIHGKYLDYIQVENLPFESFKEKELYAVLKDKEGDLFIVDDKGERWYEFELLISLK